MVLDVARAAAERGETAALSGSSGVKTWRTRSGALADSIKGRVLVRARGRLIVRLSAGAKHARFLEEGTSPHIITARRRGGRLRFAGTNGWVFRRSVNHPGNPPYRFLSRASHGAALWALHELHRRMRAIAKTF